ncbi:MAG: helical backbone metal receptor, partial [Gaiellaceae bacterium]
MSARIVCLVPSITELVCDLGLADQLVGRTGFCIHPRETLRHVPKVGGTKDVLLDRVRSLAPTHAIVNVDENTLETTDALREFVDHVVVTHPCAPRDNLDLYRLIGSTFGREREAERLCDTFASVHERIRERAERREASDVLYLIWREPWMTVTRDTYISQMLALVNWRTLPTVAADRYPEVDLKAYAG